MTCARELPCKLVLGLQKFQKVVRKLASFPINPEEFLNGADRGSSSGPAPTHTFMALCIICLAEHCSIAWAKPGGPMSFSVAAKILSWNSAVEMTGRDHPLTCMAASGQNSLGRPRHRVGTGGRHKLTEKVRGGLPARFPGRHDTVLRSIMDQ